MPPVDAIPLRIDLNSPPILVERIFPVATHETVPEYVGFGRVVLLGVQAIRQIRERQKRVEEGRRITEWRAREGLSAGAAAKRLGISRRELGRWESGEKRAPQWACGRVLEREL